MRSTSYGCGGTAAFVAKKRLISLLDKLQPYCYLVQSRLLEYLRVQQEKKLRTELSTNFRAPGEICQVLDMASFIGRPCKKRVDNILKLSRSQLRMIVAILTGHATVRKHLCVMGMFGKDPTCRFYRTETETVQHIVCC